MAKSRIRYLHDRIVTRQLAGISRRGACRRLEEYIRTTDAVPTMHEQGSKPRLMKVEEHYATSVTET
jgi:hypothetical protein